MGTRNESARTTGGTARRLPPEAWRGVVVAVLLAVGAVIGNHNAATAAPTGAPSLGPDEQAKTVLSSDQTGADPWMGDGSVDGTAAGSTPELSGVDGEPAADFAPGADFGDDGAGAVDVGSDGDIQSGGDTGGSDDRAGASSDSDAEITTTSADPAEEPGDLPSGADATPRGTETSTPAPQAPSTTSPSNQPPTLPQRPDRVVAVPVGQWTTIVADRSLSEGWRDQDSTADWLCLDFQPEDKQSWGLDGADCTGLGLRVFAPRPGVYVVHYRVKEATADRPAGGAPYSTTVNTIRIVAG